MATNFETSGSAAGDDLDKEAKIEAKRSYEALGDQADFQKKLEELESRIQGLAGEEKDALLNKHQEVLNRREEEEGLSDDELKELDKTAEEAYNQLVDRINLIEGQPIAPESVGFLVEELEKKAGEAGPGDEQDKLNKQVEELKAVQEELGAEGAAESAESKEEEGRKFENIDEVKEFVEGKQQEVGALEEKINRLEGAKKLAKDPNYPSVPPRFIEGIEKDLANAQSELAEKQEEMAGFADVQAELAKLTMLEEADEFAGRDGAQVVERDKQGIKKDLAAKQQEIVDLINKKPIEEKEEAPAETAAAEEESAEAGTAGAAGEGAGAAAAESAEAGTAGAAGEGAEKPKEEKKFEEKITLESLEKFGYVDIHPKDIKEMLTESDTEELKTILKESKGEDQKEAVKAFFAEKVKALVEQKKLPAELAEKVTENMQNALLQGLEQEARRRIGLKEQGRLLFSKKTGLKVLANVLGGLGIGYGTGMLAAVGMGLLTTSVIATGGVAVVAAGVAAFFGRKLFNKGIDKLFGTKNNDAMQKMIDKKKEDVLESGEFLNVGADGDKKLDQLSALMSNVVRETSYKVNISDKMNVESNLKNAKDGLAGYKALLKNDKKLVEEYNKLQKMGQIPPEFAFGDDKVYKKAEEAAEAWCKTVIAQVEGRVSELEDIKAEKAKADADLSKEEKEAIGLEVEQYGINKEVYKSSWNMINSNPEYKSLPVEQRKKMAVTMAMTLSQHERNNRLQGQGEKDYLDRFMQIRSGNIDPSVKGWERMAHYIGTASMAGGITAAIRFTGAGRIVGGALAGMGLGYQIGSMLENRVTRKAVAEMETMIDEGEELIKDVEFPAGDLEDRLRGDKTVVEARLRAGFFRDNPILENRAENFIHHINKLEMQASGILDKPGAAAPGEPAGEGAPEGDEGEEKPEEGKEEKEIKFENADQAKTYVRAKEEELAKAEEKLANFEEALKLASLPSAPGATEIFKERIKKDIESAKEALENKKNELAEFADAQALIRRLAGLGEAMKLVGLPSPPGAPAIFKERLEKDIADTESELLDLMNGKFGAAEAGEEPVGEAGEAKVEADKDALAILLGQLKKNNDALESQIEEDKERILKKGKWQKWLATGVGAVVGGLLGYGVGELLDDDSDKGLVAGGGDPGEGVEGGADPESMAGKYKWLVEDKNGAFSEGDGGTTEFSIDNDDYLERTMHRPVVAALRDRFVAGEDKQFGAVDSARALNVTANIDEYVQGRPGLSAYKALFNECNIKYDEASQNLSIGNFGKFEELCDKLYGHAEGKITEGNLANTGATAYIGNKDYISDMQNYMKYTEGMEGFTMTNADPDIVNAARNNLVNGNMKEWGLAPDSGTEASYDILAGKKGMNFREENFTMTNNGVELDFDYKAGGGMVLKNLPGVSTELEVDFSDIKNNNVAEQIADHQCENIASSISHMDGDQYEKMARSAEFMTDEKFVLTEDQIGKLKPLADSLAGKPAAEINTFIADGTAVKKALTEGIEAAAVTGELPAELAGADVAHIETLKTLFGEEADLVAMGINTPEDAALAASYADKLDKELIGDVFENVSDKATLEDVLEDATVLKKLSGEDVSFENVKGIADKFDLKESGGIVELKQEGVARVIAKLENVGGSKVEISPAIGLTSPINGENINLAVDFKNLDADNLGETVIRLNGQNALQTEMKIGLHQAGDKGIGDLDSAQMSALMNSPMDTFDSGNLNHADFEKVMERHMVSAGESGAENQIGHVYNRTAELFGDEAHLKHSVDVFHRESDGKTFGDFLKWYAETPKGQDQIAGQLSQEKFDELANVAENLNDAQLHAMKNMTLEQLVDSKVDPADVFEPKDVEGIRGWDEQLEKLRGWTGINTSTTLAEEMKNMTVEEMIKRRLGSI